MKKIKLKELIEVLIKDRKIAGLVKIMQLNDIVKQLSKNFDLQDKDAAIIADLLAKEGVSFGSFDRAGNTFPLHPQARKKNTINPDKAISYVYPNRSDDEEIEMEAAGNPMGKMGLRRPGIDMRKAEFPPEKHNKKPADWPYNDNNVEFMKRKNTRKMGFTR